jgi:hypothetical protein
MGKNTLASTPLAHKVISMFDPLVAMLPWNKRLIFKRFKEYILNNRAAISEATELSPVEAALLVLLLAERERTDRVHNELYARIEKMEDEPDAYL